MSELADKQCVPCKGGVPPLTGEALADLHAKLGGAEGGWEVMDGHHLAKQYRFENFVEALAFTNHVGTMAEDQKHHPDIHLSWGRVGIEIWTHKIDGLTESDFVFAARCDALEHAS